MQALKFPTSVLVGYGTTQAQHVSKYLLALE